MGRRRPRPGLSGIFAAGPQVLRFYPDGLVLDVLVRPAPGPAAGGLIESWLRRENPPPGVHEARFELRSGRVAFTTPSHFRADGTRTFRGTWRGGRLTLDTAGDGRRESAVVFTRLWP